MKEQFPIEVTEKRIVRRITLKQSVADFLDAFNVERGLIYTIKRLLTQPGSLIRDYLTDGRFKIVNAFRLLIITTALSLVILNTTGIFENLFQGAEEQTVEEARGVQLMNTLLTDWYNLALWLSIPSYALFSYLFFRKYKPFNYAEHLVMVSFYISINNLLVIAFLPFGYIMGFQLIFLAYFVCVLAYYFILFGDVYRTRRFGFFVRALASYLLGNMLYYAFFAIAIRMGLLDLLYK